MTGGLFTDHDLGGFYDEAVGEDGVKGGNYECPEIPNSDKHRIKPRWLANQGSRLWRIEAASFTRPCGPPRLPRPAIALPS